MKVFISYSTEDVKVAGSLFGEVEAAGAQVFQFGRTDTIGKPSWEQVIGWINESDIFIVLVSGPALRSRPVKEEIEQAHYSYINRDKPEKLVPAIVEAGKKPPTLIERFATVDLVDYEKGVARLMGQLGLTRHALPTGKRASSGPLPDLSGLFQEYKKKNPAPTPANEWSIGAEKLVVNYNALKPPEIAEPVRSRHLDKLLTELAGKKPSKFAGLAKYDNLLLGVEPSQEGSSPKSLDLPNLLVNWAPNSTKVPLDAPTLTANLRVLKWSEVLFATGYVLQTDITEDFTSPIEVYKGPERESPKFFCDFYRVKAVGGVFWADSPWSRVVQAPSPLSRFKLPSVLDLALETRPKLPAPQPTLAMLFGPMLTWNRVEGATGYVVERSVFPGFIVSNVVYDGDQTIYMEALTGLTTPPSRSSAPWHFRVKAKGNAQRSDSDWSKIVTTAEA